MTGQRVLLLATSIILAVACNLALYLGGLHGQAVKPKLPPLTPVFGPGADQTWNVASGEYAIAADKALGKPVLTVGKAPVVLDSKAPLAAGREMKLLLRLPTDAVPNVAATFQVGKKDAKDPKDLGLRMIVSAARGTTYVGCQVYHGAKPLHDVNELAKSSSSFRRRR